MPKSTRRPPQMYLTGERWERLDVFKGDARDEVDCHV